MLSILKSRQPPTLKVRVREFWKWFGEVAGRFHQTIERGQCPSLSPEVSRKVDEFFTGFGWVFGPGGRKGEHSFTLTAEGNPHRQNITRYWKSRAPSLPGWVFHEARQPGDIQGKVIDLGANKFDPLEFWMVPEIDVEIEKINLAVWHPLFESLPERDRWTILFLFLDEVLGEYGTEQWLAKIDLNGSRLRESIPLPELLPFIQKVENEKSWKKNPPGQAFSIYELKERNDSVLRGDIIFGSTCNMALVKAYNIENGDCDNLLNDTGADYVFVAFDSRILPKGSEAEARGDIEDALALALESAASGRVLGGALGTVRSYIDLIIFDGKESLDLIQGVLRAQKLPSGTAIRFFARERDDEKIIL